MNAIVEQKQTATPAMLLQLAVEQGADLDRLERLMALQERWEAGEAKKAFNAAFAAFKGEAVQIIKGVKITDGPLKGKMHADLFDVVSAATPALSKHGLSTAWRLSKDDKDWMEVTCTLSHVAGHSETVAMGGAPDGGPGRNAIQARGSVKTYLERYTLTAILGLAAREADDDGKGAGGAAVQDTEAELEQLAGFREAAMNGSAALRSHYEQNKVSGPFWARHNVQLKAAAAAADKAAK